jgi:hypothetical protein
MYPLCSQLHATCSCLRLNLKVFTTIRFSFNYFYHSYNYDATNENFFLAIGWLLGLSPSMNILICLINRNSHQSHILKLLYDDIKLYFYVCIKIILTIYYTYHKYIFVCILMNFKINTSVIKCIYFKVFNLIF